MLPLYTLAKSVLGGLVRVSNGIRVEGLQHLPKKGPGIIVANHVSIWDPIVLGVALNRHVAFMSKEELFRHPISAWVMKGLGAFRVRRGHADREAIREALRRLQKGRLVGIFVEGTRNKSGEKFLPPQPGASMLALRSGAPVIPVAILNTRRILKKFRDPVIIRVGAPLVLSNVDGAIRDTHAETAAAIMDAIARLYGN